MPTKIKIGGLCRLEDVDYVNEAKPDFAGVVLCKRYQWGIELEQAKAIRKRLDSNIPLVGLFVNDQYMDVLVALRQGFIDIAQLQGTESEEYIQDLKIMSRKPVIKACQVDSTDVLPYAERSAADYILMGTEPGPNLDRLMDWSLLKGMNRPYILSGGLNPENLSDAIETLHPWGVNLSTGVETNGVKDREKILAAVEIARKF